MRFNSLIFPVFLLIVVAVLWLLPQRARKPWLVFISTLFYGSWHWPYVVLLLGVVGLTDVGARWIDKVTDDPTRQKRRRWVIAALLVILAAFKYTDWLISSLNVPLGFFHVGEVPLLKWVLPLGISFYVFEAVSYIYDFTRKKEPRYSYWDLLLYVAFFPHLIAGPIMRAKEIIPQFTKLEIKSGDVSEGIRLMAGGLFLKVVLADGLAPSLDRAYARDASGLGALDVILMAGGFGLQVYFDFASYSQIAMGASKLCGIQLPKNFDFPFSAKSPTEFWNRWHMSLSHWIRDYLFYPLMGKDLRLRSMVRATLISMSLCGLWHGAGGQFIALGLYHGILIAGNHVWLSWKRDQAKKNGPAPKRSAVATWLLDTVHVVVMCFALMPGWVFFRAGSLGRAFVLIGHALSPWSHRARALPGTLYLHVAFLYLCVWAAPFVATALRSLREKAAERGTSPVVAYATFVGLFAGLALAVSAIYLNGKSTFIYFQF